MSLTNGCMKFEQRLSCCPSRISTPQWCLAIDGCAFWLAWSGLNSISDILLFVLFRISRKFLWVFYVSEVGSTEKLYPPGGYFWKENSKLLEQGSGEGRGVQERKEWVRIKKAPPGKSHMENQIDGKWDFLHEAAFSSAGRGNKSSHCLRGSEKVWISSQCLPICGTELWQTTVRVVTKQENFPFNKLQICV